MFDDNPLCNDDYDTMSTRERREAHVGVGGMVRSWSAGHRDLKSLTES